MSTHTPTQTDPLTHAIDDAFVTLYLEGAEPLLMTADEQQAADLARRAMSALDTFYGELDSTQRARLQALYEVPAASTQALNGVVQSARAKVETALAALVGRAVALDDVRIHTARAQAPAVSEPLWHWLARGTPVQLASPRLTADANRFVEQSWLTVAGKPLLKQDDQPVTMDAIIDLGRILDIGEDIARQCDDWAALPGTQTANRREGDARLELALLHARRTGQISREHHCQVIAAAGLGAAAMVTDHWALAVGSPPAGHFLLRVEGHDLPVVAIKAQQRVYIVANTFPEPRLFLADAQNDHTALQVFGQAFRQDLWATRNERSGWSWSLLSPAAQEAVGARLPQPLPPATRYPATAHFVPGAGAYASHAEYQRGASAVRFTAPYPLVRRSAAQAWAQAHSMLLVRRIKERFTANRDSSLAHARRIGSEWLSTVLDVILIAVPGEVRFPGRAQLFKALFGKQLAVDLPLSLVQAKWEDVGQTLVDFFETVLEMQALKRAGRLLKSRLATLSSSLAPAHPLVPGSAQPITTTERLRSMLPRDQQRLDDAQLADVLRRAGVDGQALEGMQQGRVTMDMALVAAIGEVRNRQWVEQSPGRLAAGEQGMLPEAVEWAVVGCLCLTLQRRLTVRDSDGAALRTFEPEGIPLGEGVLMRRGHWRYGPQTDDAPAQRADSLFMQASELLQPTLTAPDRRRQAQALRGDIAAQLASAEGAYRLARALHHGDRPRASVPAADGHWLAVTVNGNPSVAPGRLRDADAATVSVDCERRVPDPGSLSNLGKARYQADLAAIAGGPGRAGRQTLSEMAQHLYFEGVMALLDEHSLADTVAIRVKAAGRSVAAWGQPEATHVLVLQRRGDAQAYAYLGELMARDVLAPAADTDVPVSDLLLRLLDDRARQALGIRLGDAVRFNTLVQQRIPRPGDQARMRGDLHGVGAQGDPQLLACVQAVTLTAQPAANGVIEQDGRYWLPWAEGSVALAREGQLWRALRPDPGETRGPLLAHQYGEWRCLQAPLRALDELADGPVSGGELVGRLSALYRADPLARIYHDAVTVTAVGAGGARYIALRGQPTRFYRIKPVEAGALEVEVVRPGGTGGGVWLRHDERGLWHVARTLAGGMDNPAEPELWRPWARPSAQPLPVTFGLLGSTYERLINPRSGRHKALNRFYPFVRPSGRAEEYKTLLEQAPAFARAPTRSDNIVAKVELFHQRWGLPLDLTALPFFRVPGDVSSEIKHLNGRLLADLVTATVAGQPVISRILEPMSGSGFYTNFVRACGFRGEIRVNDINPLVTLTQQEIVQQPDAVVQQILNIKQDLLDFWEARHDAVRFDPHSLRANFPDEAAARAFVHSPEVKRFREDLRHYFYSTVETQYTLVNGRIEISEHSSFRSDPVNGLAQARAYIAAAFYIMQNNSTRHQAAVRINVLGRLDLPLSSMIKEGQLGAVLLLPSGFSNLGGLAYLSHLNQGARGRTVFSTGDGWDMLRVVEGQSNLGDLAIISGHFSDVYVDEVQFMENVREFVMPFVRNRGRVIITNAYSPFKERAFIDLGLRVFVLENRTSGFLLVMNDAVARDVGVPNA